MKLAFLIAVVAGSAVLADTVINVTRIPQVTVTIDGDSNTVGVVTGVCYLVEVPLQPQGAYRDQVCFDSLSAVLANPSVVTNAIFSQCVSWAPRFKAEWNLVHPTINFSAADPVEITNQQVQAP